jgi:hypothetical protein
VHGSSPRPPSRILSCADEPRRLLVGSLTSDAEPSCVTVRRRTVGQGRSHVAWRLGRRERPENVG